MPNLFTEDTYEQAIIELFENMGYDHLYAPDFDRDYTSPILDSILRDSLVRINRGLPVEAIDEAMSKLKNFDTGSLLQKNMIFMDYLQNGVTIKFFVKRDAGAAQRLYHPHPGPAHPALTGQPLLSAGVRRRQPGLGPVLLPWVRAQPGGHL